MVLECVVLMMASPAATFWLEMERYHDLAQQFEENIVLAHPPYATGGEACRWSYRCLWNATNIERYEYRGPSI